MRGQKLLNAPADYHFAEFPGLGVTVTQADGTWSLGKSGWLADGPTGKSEASELRNDGRLVASFQFSESLRSGAVPMLRRLEQNGLRVHLLSGDHPDKVARMAAALGVAAADALGGLSPEEKETEVRRIDRQDTLYLGDGANDSLAFEAAFVTGTPVVDRSLLESKADFYTLGAGLEFLPRLLDAAVARRNAVRAAFAFALVYNVTTVAWSFSGNMSPLLAAILMPLSSIVSIVIVATLSRRRLLNKG
jgi:Cu2+-exporting ATPase